MHAPEHMRAARAAMLQAALAAFFADCEQDGAEEVTLQVSREEGGHVVIDIAHLVKGVAVVGYDL